MFITLDIAVHDAGVDHISFS